jgi:hypothetical protein
MGLIERCSYPGKKKKPDEGGMMSLIAAASDASAHVDFQLLQGVTSPFAEHSHCAPVTMSNVNRMPQSSVARLLAIYDG